MAARHLHGPARRRPQRGSAAIARPGLGSDRRDADTGLASSSPSYRDRKLGELGKPLTALLTTATAAGFLRTLGTISGYIQQLEGDPVAALEIAVLRAAADLRAEAAPSADLSPDEAEFRDRAADCAARRFRYQHGFSTPVRDECRFRARIRF
jgi:hypothetical protein